jgi:hypothetical protein
METHEQIPSLTQNMPSDEKESAGSDRRCFLRQVAAAGAGSAALAALIAAGGRQNAEAAQPAAGQRTVRTTAYDIQVAPDPQNVGAQRVTVNVSGQTMSQTKSSALGALVTFSLPLDGSDGGAALNTSTVAIQAVWWTPRSGIATLTAFNHIAVGTNAAGTTLELEIEVVPNLSPSLTIDTFILHDPA